MAEQKFCEIEDTQCRVDTENNFHMHIFLIKQNRVIEFEGFQGRMGDLWIQIYN